MADFNGSFDHTIDPKGRMFIPAELRDELGNDFFVLRYRDEKCLFIMTRTDHGNLAANLKRVKLPAADAAREQRQFRANSYKADMDGQNRVLIPAELRKQVNLGNKVLVVGMGTRVEIWDPETWRDAMGGSSNLSQDAEEELNNLINL